MTISSPVATAEFSKFADILSAALSQHHLLGITNRHQKSEKDALGVQDQKRKLDVGRGKFWKWASVLCQFPSFCKGSKGAGLPQVVHLLRTCLKFRRHWRYGFDSWFGKIPWRRAQQPIPVFLPGESHAQRSLAGYRP